MQRYNHLLICTIRACPWDKTFSNLVQAGFTLVESAAHKPLEKLSPFEVLWNFLQLQLSIIMISYPFDPYGLAHGPEHIFLKVLDGFSRSKFHDIFSICSCTAPWSCTIWSSIGFSKHLVLQPHGYLPIWSICAFPWVRIYISKITRSHFAVGNSMKRSRPVIVDCHCILPVIPI